MRPIASCVSSTEETFFAFSADAISTAVLKLHGDLAKAHSRSVSRNGADDAQFGQAPQEQWLYSGTIRIRYCPIRAFAGVANKGVTTWPRGISAAGMCSRPQEER
jgi:hypothetical protein